MAVACDSSGASVGFRLVEVGDVSLKTCSLMLSTSETVLADSVRCSRGLLPSGRLLKRPLASEKAGSSPVADCFSPPAEPPASCRNFCSFSRFCCMVRVMMPPQGRLIFLQTCPLTPLPLPPPPAPPAPPPAAAFASRAFDCSELKRALLKKREHPMPMPAEAAAAAAADAELTSEEAAEAKEEALEMRRSSCCIRNSFQPMLCSGGIEMKR